MRSQNNNRWLLLVVGLVLVVALVVWQVVSVNNKKTKAPESSYYDPNSKETVSNPAGKTPESFGNSNNLVYLGYSKLIDTGTTQSQLESIKQATLDFSKANHLDATEASIKVDSIKPILNDSESGVDFPLVINRSSTFTIQVRYTSLDNISFAAFSGTTKVYQSSTNTPKQDPNEAVE